jgi:hypothetical protein
MAMLVAISISCSFHVQPAEAKATVHRGLIPKPDRSFMKLTGEQEQAWKHIFPSSAESRPASPTKA